MSNQRLRAQGFTNLYRKLIFRLTAIALISYLFLMPNPWSFSSPVELTIEITGLMLIFFGIIGRVLATLSIGGLKDRMIVKTELYSVCRNPLYFASFLMAIGLGLVSVRLDFTLLTTGAFLAIFLPMMKNEARMLRSKFDDYADYEGRTPLFFPNFRLWEERERFQFSFKLVKRTLLDASIVLVVAPIILALHLLV